VALKGQPYIPLYVQDFMTDEKLIECSAAANGVYIRIMCILHKSDDYGCILLKQKDKQTDSTIKNFALKFLKQMPYDLKTIEDGLTELIDEKVLIIDGDLLYQKRMRKDGLISEERSKSGKKGIKAKQEKNNFVNNFAIANTTAKIKQNSENEIVVVVENENDNKEINILSIYENNIGTLSSIITEKLIEFEHDYGFFKVKKAIEISVLNGVRKLSYIEGILKSWGNKTWDEILEDEINFKNKKNIENEETFEERLRKQKEIEEKERNAKKWSNVINS